MHPPPFKLTIVPIGEEDEMALSHLFAELPSIGADVTVEDRVPAPEDAFNPRREQYMARSFIRLLGAFGGDRVLGVTDRDLYMSGLNFVFGQAEAPGRAAVISTNRLRWGVDGDAFLERCLTEAMHELGHTFGLSHCEDRRCVMHFSETLSDTDYKGHAFCEGCSRELMRLRVRQR